MSVNVVDVGHMRVGMRHWGMPMQVAVDARWHGIVEVVVVAIVMAVGMLVRHGFMVVSVTVRLGQVQHNASQH